MINNRGFVGLMTALAVVAGAFVAWQWAELTSDDRASAVLPLVIGLAVSLTLFVALFVLARRRDRRDGSGASAVPMIGVVLGAASVPFLDALPTPAQFGFYGVAIGSFLGTAIAAARVEEAPPQAR